MPGAHAARGLARACICGGVAEPIRVDAPSSCHTEPGCKGPIGVKVPWVGAMPFPSVSQVRGGLDLEEERQQGSGEVL